MFRVCKEKKIWVINLISATVLQKDLKLIFYDNTKKNDKHSSISNICPWSLRFLRSRCKQICFSKWKIREQNVPKHVKHGRNKRHQKVPSSIGLSGRGEYFLCSKPFIFLLGAKHFGGDCSATYIYANLDRRATFTLLNCRLLEK